jgi:flagellar basal body rod protein FlgG
VSHGIYTALSGAVAQEISLEQTAQNLANSSTAGYRAAHPVFHEVLAQAGNTKGGPPLRFAGMAETTLDTTAGDVRETGRPLDVSLAQADFLAVSTPGGERYTRAGALQVGADGTLQGPGGHPVLGEDQKPIKVPPGAQVAIQADGSVKAGQEVIGRLRIVALTNPEKMVREGDTLLAQGGAGAPAPSPRGVSPGSLEGSNASPIKGMTELMRVTRTFDAVQRAIDAFHDADRKVNTVASR